MLTLLFYLLIILIIAAGVFLYIRYNIEINKAQNRVPERKIRKVSKPVLKQSSSDTQWRAVKMKPGLMCCRFAESMRGKVFLAAEAPVFPLNQCTQKECGCKYTHLEDRRDGDDRRQATDYLDDLYDMHQKDRRSGKGRRFTDMDRRR